MRPFVYHFHHSLCTFRFCATTFIAPCFGAVIRRPCFGPCCFGLARERPFVWPCCFGVVIRRPYVWPCYVGPARKRQYFDHVAVGTSPPGQASKVPGSPASRASKPLKSTASKPPSLQAAHATLHAFSGQNWIPLGDNVCIHFDYHDHFSNRFASHRIPSLRFFKNATT